MLGIPCIILSKRGKQCKNPNYLGFLFFLSLEFFPDLKYTYFMPGSETSITAIGSLRW